MKVVGIGACVCDTLVNVPFYPEEDTKLKADGVKTAGGGPCATGLVASQKLGVDSAFIGVLSDDAGGSFLLKDFEKFGVDTSGIAVEHGYRSFTSTIWLAEKNASRTCVFDRGNLPKLKLNKNTEAMVKNAEILMVDGNELEGAVEAAKIAKANGTLVLYDCGGLYEGVEKLLKLTDIMIPSVEFAKKHTNSQTAEEAAKKLMETYHPQIVVVTCGKLGGVYFDGTELSTYPAFSVKAVDTNGSGDVFHGAFAAGITLGLNYKKCCVFSSAVSALKCTGIGARESVPAISKVYEFLKENGYEF